MKTIKTFRDWKQEWIAIRSSDKSIGFVPTMGALHAGHISLIENCKKENDITVVSIYVNPTQFNDPDDLKRYPVTIDSDKKILEGLEVDYLFLPDSEEMYPDRYKYVVEEKEFSKKLCGSSRPGHFNGVLTVVLKLLNGIKADCAFFGEKDYQQYLLVRGMAEAFFIDTRIVPVPVVRDKNGLALSSRNSLLDHKSLGIAPEFHKILTSSGSAGEAARLLKEKGFTVDYVEEFDNRRYGAVRIGGVRLIDNVQL